MSQSIDFSSPYYYQPQSPSLTRSRSLISTHMLLEEEQDSITAASTDNIIQHIALHREHSDPIQDAKDILLQEPLSYIDPWDIDYWAWTIISRGFPHKPHNTNREWNNEYQRLLEVPVSSPYEWKQRNDALDALINDFLNFAAEICDILVRETVLPNRSRTIPQLTNTSGRAGGDKYITGGCFFKFAKEKTGERPLYGGDAFAAKSASNELRAMNSIISCHITGLHLPLAAVFYCRGHCIYVSAKVPIDGTRTLVCGSCDLGFTVKNDSEDIKEISDYFGSVFNLKRHPVRCRSPIEHPVDLVTSGDVEFHLSDEDGRLYVVDCARFFPPTPCSDGSMSYMYNQFRPEFMKNCIENGIQLCSDTYTRWCMDSIKDDISTIQKSFSFLLNHVIPNVCKRLITEENSTSLSKITEVLHQEGINLRYLGNVYLNFPQESILREYVSFEMYCRCSKVRLRACLRYTSSVTDSSSLILASRFLLDVFGETSYSEIYWKSIVTKEIFKKYSISLSQPEIVNIRGKLSEDMYIKHFLQSIGVSLSERMTTQDLAHFCRKSQKFEVDFILPCIMLLMKVKKTFVPPALGLKNAATKLESLISQRESVLGDRSPKLLHPLYQLLDLYNMYGNDFFQPGYQVGQKIISICRSVYEEEKSDDARMCLADSLLRMGRYLLQMQHHEDPAGYLIEAKKLFDCDLSEASIAKSLKCVRKLAMIHHKAGRMDICEKLLIDGVEAAKKTFGNRHQVVALMLNRLGWMYDTLDMLRESQQALMEALSIREELMPDTYHTASSLVFLAGNRRAWSRVSDKEDCEEPPIQEMYTRAVRIMETLYGIAHFKTNDFYNGLAGYYVSQRKLEEALDLYGRIHESRIQHHGKRHVNVAWTLNSRANAYMSSVPPRLQEAGNDYCTALEILESESVLPLNNIAWTKRTIACWLLKMKQFTDMQVPEEIRTYLKLDTSKPHCLSAKAKEMFFNALEIQESICHRKCPRIADTYAMIAEYELEQEGNRGEAICYLLKAIVIYQESFGTTSLPFKKCHKLLQECGYGYILT